MKRYSPALLSPPFSQISIDLQKSRRHGNGHPLVSINEGMALRQALPECCRFLKNIRIMAALRPRGCGFEGAIPDAKETSELRD